MTYSQAKMIVWNSETYTSAQVREAAIFIMGSFEVSTEDLLQAASLL